MSDTETETETPAVEDTSLQTTIAAIVTADAATTDTQINDHIESVVTEPSVIDQEATTAAVSAVSEAPAVTDPEAVAAVTAAVVAVATATTETTTDPVALVDAIVTAVASAPAVTNNDAVVNAVVAIAAVIAATTGDNPSQEMVDTIASAVSLDPVFAEQTSAITETPVVQTPVVEQPAEVAQVVEPVVESVAVVQPVIVETPAVVVAPVVESYVDTQPEPSIDPVQAMISTMKVNGSASAKGVIFDLEAYVERMRPGMGLTKDEGAKIQHKLWRTLRQLIDSDTEDFTEVFRVVLAIAHRYKDGAFNERYLFRFTDEVNLSREEMKSFLALLDLIKITADPKGRVHALKQVDFHRTMEHHWSERARQRVATFYNL